MTSTTRTRTRSPRTSTLTRWILGGLSAAGLTLALGTGLVLADDGDSQKPDRAALQVCKDQIQAICGDVEPGEGRIKACVEAHQDELDPQCQALAERKAKKADKKKGKSGKKGKKGKKGKNRKAQRKQLEQVCGEDIRQACGDLEPGDGRIKACIQENVQSFSPACQQAIEEKRQK